MRNPPQEGLIHLRFDLGIHEEAIKTKCSFIFVNFIIAIAHGFGYLLMKAHYFRVNYHISQSFLKRQILHLLLITPFFKPCPSNIFYLWFYSDTHTHKQTHEKCGDFFHFTNVWWTTWDILSGFFKL